MYDIVKNNILYNKIYIYIYEMFCYLNILKCFQNNN